MISQSQPIAIDQSISFTATSIKSEDCQNISQLQRKFTHIEIPTDINFLYRGSNAEYIVLKKEGSDLKEEEYKTIAYPVLSQQFPRTMDIESKLTKEQLEALDSNEAEYIDKALDNENLKAIRIPKTLYDLF